jgi:hypothetical protein
MHNALYLYFEVENSVSLLPFSKAPRRKAPPLFRHRKQLKTQGLNLCLISANSFFINLKRHHNHKHRYSKEFSFSMLMLNRTIKDKLANEDKETREQILNKLLREYQKFADIFSKIKNGLLPPYRPIDHKMELLPDAAPLRAHPLYSMSTNQLIALKKYLTEALRKEWIVPSAAEYGSPVLFAKKPNGELRFCMNYRAMNARSKKNVYPLPLIFKTLERLGKIKIFTKLDVRNAFHRIRMNEASEDNITFRTRFG